METLVVLVSLGHQQINPGQAQGCRQSDHCSNGGSAESVIEWLKIHWKAVDKISNKRFVASALIGRF
jgi:hypothetical protein